MLKENKYASIQADIRIILVRLEQIECKHSELCEEEKALTIELSELLQIYSELLAK